MLSVADALSLGAGATRRQAWLVVPLSLSIAVARLLSFVPLLFVMAHAWRNAQRIDVAEPELATALGFIETLFDPTVWLVSIQGMLLATFGAALIGYIIEAACVRQLTAQLGRKETVDDSHFSERFLESSILGLSAGLVAGILRFFALFCAIGMVAAGMAFFTTKPGVTAALLMTIATAALVLIPTLTAALDVGFVRAVLRAEDPFTAIGNGLLLAFNRSGVLIPVWFLLGVVELAITFVTAAMSGTIGALPSDENFWVLLLGPRAVVWLVGVVLTAFVTLWKLGSYASLVVEEAGLLPEPPRREPEEIIYQAIPIAAVAAPISTAGLVDEGSDSVRTPDVTPDEGSE